MKRKKNRFLTFLCSLVPGAGEMYMGFMKMGLSLLIAFMGVIMLAVFTNIDELLFVVFVIWIYSFFHANNLAGMPDQEFQKLEDNYLIPFDGGQNMSQTIQKLIAGILIFFGVILLEKELVKMMPDFLREYVTPVMNLLPRMAVAVVLILLGIMMIRGKREKLEESVPYHTGASPVTPPGPVQPELQEPVKAEQNSDTATPAAIVQNATPELPAPDNNLQ